MKKHILINALLLTMALLYNSCESDSSNMAPGTAGTGGSMARFAITGDYLYTVTNSTLKVFDISQPENPQPGAEVKLGVRIETIFPYESNLFIGSQTGMHIYNNENPDKPTLISVYEHVQSCDPVVVQGKYAYVTLRDGNSCRNGRNLLDVIDISDLKSPRLISSYAMKNPHGLGIDGNRLFVCEGDYGLKVLDATKPDSVFQTHFIEGIKTYDVIPRNQILIVVGSDGLHQYDYSDPQKMTLLSTLPIYH